jgi:hypothetical protein
MKDVDGEIARRAYRRYQERGGGEGRELDDWLAAQRDAQGESKEASVEDQQEPAPSQKRQ